MKLVTKHVRGGISVGSEAGSLGIIGEETHGRSKTAAIAIDAISIVFFV